MDKQAPASGDRPDNRIERTIESWRVIVMAIVAVTVLLLTEAGAIQ